MAKLFGFSIEDTEKQSPSIISPVPPNNQDGSDYYLTSGFFGSYVDIEGVYKTEFDLIKRYREMALHPEVDSAIEDVVNEAIVSDTNDSPIQIELSNLNASDGIKQKIRDEFRYILELLDFDKKSHEIYRNWFIDGRLYYHKVIDMKKPHEGIQELRYIDSLKIRHIRQQKKVKNDGARKTLIYGSQDPMDFEFPEIEEYFVYNPKTQYPVGTPSAMSGGSEKGIKMSKDSITYCTSGLVDLNKGTILSFLHKAIKSLNQLRMIEDSLVIYRLSRASERRIFYIDVGNLPKQKAEQYLKDVMMRYRNKQVYDSATGEIKDDKKFMSMMEDFWLPRREGGRGTEVTTLPGGCLEMSTKVPLLDGRELSIKDIETELNTGNKLWAYSCHPTTGKIEPGLISWAGVTQKSAKVIKITLDNGESITCTYDHKFPIYNVGFVEAKDLEVGQSMIPFYKKTKEIKKGSNEYEMIYDNESKKWIYTHRLVANTFKEIICEDNVFEQNDENKNTIHHINLNRFDNSPENLCFMNSLDHILYHKSIGFSIEEQLKWTLAAKEKLIELKNNPIEYEKYCSRISQNSKAFWNNLSEEERIDQIEKIRNGSINHFNNISDEEYAKKINTSISNLEGVSEALQIKLQDNEWFRQRLSDGWSEESRKNASECSLFNHNITSIEYLPNEIEVGTLTIDSDEIFHNYHTFALSSGVFTKNSNLGEITDLAYFQKKLYKSLNVPSSRIDGDGGFNLGRSSEILRDEVKFSKFVARLRKRFSNMFSDMLRTQLLLKNIITPEDWDKMNEHIQYDFLYDNHFAELRDSELLTDRLNLVSAAEPYIGKYYSQDYVRRHILRQTDQEIIDQDELMKKEIEDGVIPDPSIPIDPTTGQPMPDFTGQEGDLGKVPMDPEANKKAIEMPKGGEI